MLRFFDCNTAVGRWKHSRPGGYESAAELEAILDYTQVEQAVVYDPSRNDLFFASKGRGAFLNDRRLRVSKRIRMNEALIGTGLPHAGRGDVATWARIYGAIGPEVSGIRRFGAASLDFAWVAAGRMDGFWEDDLDIWDVAAG